MNRFLVLCVATVAGLLPLAMSAAADPPPAGEPSPVMDERLKPIAGLPNTGPFVRAADNALICLRGNTLYRSSDEGASWQTQPLAELDAMNLRPRSGHALVRTPKDTLVLLFLNDNDRLWSWNKETGQLEGEARLHTWAARSEDHGKTWVDIQQIQDGYAGALRDATATRDGHIVAALQKWLPTERRHATIPTVSLDDGRTWQATGVLDVGGRGHHDGAYEASVVELNDGRVWMLLRTNLDFFWQSYSADGGLTWSAPSPTTIDASSAPGFVKRLASGRLALVWNRLYPEGKSESRRIGGQYSEREASWQRQELSLALSEDDGRTWSDPVVVARGRSLAYPLLFEPRPGVIWIFAPRGPLRAEAREVDFVVTSAEGATPPAPSAAEPVCVVALGDSITKGARPARGDRAAVQHAETFASLLQGRLREHFANARVVNSGVSGNRTDQAVVRLDKDVLAEDPAVVLIMFGTNDSCFDTGKTAARLPVEEYERNLRSIVERVRAKGAKPILMTPLPLGTGWGFGRNTVYVQQGPNGPITPYVEVCRKVATESGVPLVDHFAEWRAEAASTIDARMVDGCHPNAAGHAVMAESIAPVLMRELGLPER